MTTKDLLEATTPNALEEASADRLDHLYNLICGKLVDEGEPIARQLQARIQAIHAEKVRRQGEEIAREAKRPHWSVAPNFWMTLAILVLTAIGATAAVIALFR